MSAILLLTLITAALSWLSWPPTEPHPQHAEPRHTPQQPPGKAPNQQRRSRAP